MDFENLNSEIKKKNDLVKMRSGNLTVVEVIESLKERLNLSELIALSEGYTIVDEETAKNALSMSLQARKLKKVIDESRSEIIRPHLDFQRAINKIVKDYESKLTEIEKSLSEKINSWLEIRNATAEKEDFSPLLIKEIEVEDGTLALKKSWEWEVEDISKVPRSYLCLDEKKINEDIKLGLRTISGLKIFPKEKVSLRVKN